MPTTKTLERANDAPPTVDGPCGQVSMSGAPLIFNRDNLLRSYWRLFREFRRQDLREFCERHDRLYREALREQNHLQVTDHYYSLMASVIATYYGDGWHFCPPEHPGQSRADATGRMYRRMSNLMGLGPGRSALDIGCGVGGMLRYLARHSGAELTGITLGADEVRQANRLCTESGLDQACRVVQGDSQQMPFESSSFDAVYAVYALKYYPQLDRVLGEIQRVLKPGGRFVTYCLCKSKNFREDDPAHEKLVHDFEYSTAMPPLHGVLQIIQSARNAGLECRSEEDLSRGDLTWYAYWVQNPLLPWLVSSRLVHGLVKTAEFLRMLPPGFAQFNDTFLAGTIRHIIRGGKTGVLTGSALLTFVKPDSPT